MTQCERMADGAFWSADAVISISLHEEAGRTHVHVEHSGFERLPGGIPGANLRRVWAWLADGD